MRYLIVMVCLVLCTNCTNQNGKFNPSGRSVEQIMEDIKQQNYDHDKPLVEVVAYDFCDCISTISYKKALQQTKEKNPSMSSVAELMDAALKLYSCKVVDRQHEGFSANNKRSDSYKSYMEQIDMQCPELYALFQQLDNYVTGEEE